MSENVDYVNYVPIPGHERHGDKVGLARPIVAATVLQGGGSTTDIAEVLNGLACHAGPLPTGQPVQ